MLNLILFGPPGAGKGTHSVQIAKRYKLIHLSTGDIFRSEISNKTKLGVKAKSYIDKGNLVPDDVVIDMLFSFIEKNLHVNGFVFDGFPRTIVQAEKFNQSLEDLKIPVSYVISLEVNEDELITRLVKRGIESGRADDTEEIIKQRLDVYNDQTKPLLDYYSKKNLLKNVYGVGNIDDIFKEICKIIEK